MDYTIDAPIQAIESQIEVLTDYLDHKFADAADVSYGRYLIKQYDRLEAAKKLLIALTLNRICLKLQSDSAPYLSQSPRGW
jgi:hypothetical protein